MAANRTLTAVPGITVGHAQDVEGATGCTVVLGPFVAAVEVRGLATGSRELDALSPLHLVPSCDALLLTGGSAFGLAAADGVTRWLEERGRGYETRVAVVPIVPAAVIYDLAVGDPRARPDAEMGYAAAEAAATRPVGEGRVGVGTGASVGKLRPEGLELAGVGSWSDSDGEHVVAALAVVNAFGDVLDDRGRIMAGSRAADGSYLDTARAIREGRAPEWPVRPGENTTLAVVATDAPLGKSELQVVARQAMNAVVRRISPANTAFDGDIVFAASTGEVSRSGPPAAEPVELLSIGLRAQHALERALQRAVRR